MAYNSSQSPSRAGGSVLGNASPSQDPAVSRTPIIYALDLASLLERPVLDVLRVAEVSISLRSPVSEVLEAADVVLAWLSTSALADGDAHAAASRFLREVCVSYPTVALSVIRAAASVQHPKEFIAELPAILSSSPAFVVEECFDELVQLSESPLIAVAVLSAVLGIELSATCRNKVVEATYRALSILSESDFPALFKLIFVNLSVFVGTKVIRKIRSEISALPIDSVVVLLVESLLDTVLYFTAVVNSLLRDVLLAADRSQPSIFDVSVALIAFNLPECHNARDQLLLKWLRNQVFPFDKLEDLIQRRSTNEVWNRLVPAISELMVWLFQKIVDVCPQEQKTKREFARIALLYYVQNVGRRESWVVYLLSECFRVRGVLCLSQTPRAAADAKQPQALALKRAGVKSRSTVGYSLSNLPTLGAAFHSARGGGRGRASTSAATTDRSHRAIVRYLGRLNLAIQILESLVQLRDAGVVTIFHRFLLEKIRPDSYDASRRNKLCLPPPAAMFRILSCYFLADSNRDGDGVSNALMITIQKLLCSNANVIDVDLTGILKLVHSSESQLVEKEKLTNQRGASTGAVKAKKRASQSRSATHDDLYLRGLVDEVVDNSTPQLVGLMMALVLISGGHNSKLSANQGFLSITSPSSSSSSSSSSTAPNRVDSSAINRSARESGSSDFSQQRVILNWILQAIPHSNDESIIYLIECVSKMLNTADQHMSRGLPQDKQIISAGEDCLKALVNRFNFIKSESSIQQKSPDFIFRLRELSMELVGAVVRIPPSPSSWARAVSITGGAFWSVFATARLIFRLSILQARHDVDRNGAKIAYSLATAEIVEGLSTLNIKLTPRDDEDDGGADNESYPNDVVYYVNTEDKSSNTLTNIIQWPDSAGDYVSNETPLGTDDNVSSLLQSAWENALFAGVLVAQLQSHRGQYINSYIEVYLRALAAMSQAREYLRLSGPFVMDTSHHSSGAESGLAEPIIDDGHQKTYRSAQRNMAMEMHIKMLQRALDRLPLMISASCISDGVKHVMESVYSEMSSSDAEPASLKNVFTAGGAQVISTLAAKCLTSSDRNDDADPFQFESSIYDSIVLTDEMFPEADITNLNSLIIELIGTVPALMLASEKLLLNTSGVSESQTAVSSSLGSYIDYPSRCMLIALIVRMAESEFEKCAVKGNKLSLESWVETPIVKGIISFEGRIKNLDNATELFFSFLKRLHSAILESRDGLVAIVGIRLANLLVRPLVDYSALLQSQQALMWRVASGIQSSFTSIASYRHSHMTGIFPVGRGLLWTCLNAYINSMCQYQTVTEVSQPMPKRSRKEANVAKREVEMRYIRTMWMNYIDCMTEEHILTVCGVSNVLITIAKYSLGAVSETNGSSSSSSPQKRRASVERSPGGQKRTRIDASADGHIYSLPSKTESTDLFPRLHYDNAADLFDIVLQSIPLVMQRFIPNNCGVRNVLNELSSSAPIDISLIQDPYLSLLIVISSLIDITQGISLHLKPSTLAIRSNSVALLHDNLLSIFYSMISRLPLLFDTLKEVIERCIVWRSTGTGTETDTSSDVSSIERLLFLMKLSVYMSRKIITLMKEIKQSYLSNSKSDLAVLKRLVRILPRMSSLCEDHVDYIHQAISKHGMQITDISTNDEERLKGLSILLLNLEQVRLRRNSAASQPSLEAWMTQKSFINVSAPAPSSIDVVNSAQNVPILRQSDATVSGWGLYAFYDESSKEVNSEVLSQTKGERKIMGDSLNIALVPIVDASAEGVKDDLNDGGTETESDLYDDLDEEEAYFDDDELMEFDDNVLDDYMSEIDEIMDDASYLEDSEAGSENEYHES